MKNKVFENWSIYYQSNLIKEELEDKLSLDNEEIFSVSDKLDKFHDTSFEKDKEGYKNSVVEFSTTIKLIEVKMERVTKKMQRIVKRVSQNAARENVEILDLQIYLDNLYQNSQSIISFLENSKKEMDHSASRISHYRANLFDKRNRWFNDKDKEREKEEITTPDVDVIKSTIMKKMQIKVEKLLTELDETQDLLKDLLEIIYNKIKLKQIEDENEAARQEKLTKKVEFVEKSIEKAISIIANIFSPVTGIGLGLFENNIKVLPKTTVIGEISFEKDRDLEGTKGETYSAFISMKDNSKIRIYVVGDNPFENETLKSLEGKIVGATGIVKNKTLRVQKGDLHLQK